MKIQSYFAIAALLFVNLRWLHGQGTIVYDQQSSIDESAWPYGAGPTIQGITAPFGQSFTPSFTPLDFIRLNLNDPDPVNGSGAILYVNVRANSITGPILSSTSSVSLANGFTGVVSFLFGNTVSLTPGEVYYFEPKVQSGELWNIAVSEYNYPGGTVFANGLPVGGMSDVWFREGVLVPEPGTWALLLLGVAVFVWRNRLRS